MYKPDQKMVDRVNNDFTYHPPIPGSGQIERYATIRDLGKYFAQRLLELTPPSREQSLALTAIEEAVMWSNAAIARNE